MEQLLIDKDFKDFIPPLAKEEYEQLEKNIVAYGCREPLSVWRGFIIDGHNRYKIAQKHNLPYNHKRMEFPDRESVKRWIILNQFGRRNLSAYDRSILALKLKPIIAEQAKEKETERKTTYQKSEKSSLPTCNTTKELAKVAGVSHDTIHKVEVIQNSGDKKLIDDIRKGETSINRAYQTVKGIDPIKPKTMAQMKKEHLDQAKEEHENFQSQKVVGVSDIAKDKENRKKIAEALRFNLLNIGKPIENFYARMTEGEINMKEFRKELSDKEADQIIEMIAIWRHDLYLISQEVIGD